MLTWTRHWRNGGQGDCVLGAQWFVHRANPALGLTAAADDDDGEATDLIETPVHGLVVLTQTCDIVRRCADRPFLEVAPLVQVEPDLLRDIERARRPNYAFVPTLASQGFVADLDRVMTIEKPVATTWERVTGCRSDAESRQFAQALARKRARFAFPDDFNRFTRKLQQRMVEKHGKESPEGRALRALREIRIQAEPSWDADAVSLIFWFLREAGQADFEGLPWHDLQARWHALIEPADRFVDVECQVAELADMTASEYVHSDPLDLDHLSSSRDG